MGRRGNGEGGITRHKKSGLYMARYTVQTATRPKRKPSTARRARRQRRSSPRRWPIGTADWSLTLRTKP